MTDQHDETENAEQHDAVPEYIEPEAYEHEQFTRISFGGFREHGSKAQIAALYTAFAKAQLEFPDIPKTATGRITQTQTFKYAPLATVLKGCRPALNKHGLGILFPWGLEPGKLHVTVLLTHAEGGRLTCYATRSVNNDMKAIGADRTYITRYGASSMLGVDSDADADEFPDGGQATQGEPRDSKPEPAKPQQRRQQSKPGPAPAPAGTPEPEKPKPEPAPERPRSEPPPAVVETVATELPEAPAELPATERGPARTAAQGEALIELSKALGFNSLQLAQILREHTGHALTALREPGGEKLANVLIGILKAKYEESQE